jgi:hypothetical protein
LLNIDPELLVELASERRGDGLAWLDLAAGKFPVAGVHLAVWPLRKQERAVAALDHGGRYFNDISAS